MKSSSLFQLIVYTLIVACLALTVLLPTFHAPLLLSAAVVSVVGAAASLRTKLEKEPAATNNESEAQARLQKLVGLINKYDVRIPPTVTDANLYDHLEAGIREIVRNGRAVIENALDVICTIDADNRFMTANASARSILGYSPEELIGHRFTDFLAEDDVGKSVSAALGASKSLDKVSIENRWKRKDGQVIDLLWSAHWSSQAATLFCVIHDITDRKQAEQMLRISEETLRTVLENLPSGVVLANEEGTIGYANPNAYALTKANATYLTGETLGIFFPATRLQDKLKDATSTTIFETNLRKETGEIVPVEVIISPLQRNLRGTTRLVVFTDISERRRIEQSKRELAAMVSHELKTPLSAIQITLDLLAEGTCGTLTERGNSLVKKGATEVSRIVRLIQDMLDFEKINTGSFDVHPLETSLLALINSSVEAVRPLAEERHINLQIQLKSDLEVIADGIRIIQVLINLLSNAIKFSPDSSTIKIGATVQNKLARIFVEDKGRGIPDEHLGLIFKKYHQVHPTDQHRLGGSGLGLAIAHSIVEKHAGEMGVDSTYGKGSTFWFTLQIAEE